jgi:fluoroquinolone resistance protein
MEEQFHEDKTFEKISYLEKVVNNRVFERCVFKQCDLSKSNFSNCRFIDCTFLACNLSMLKLRDSTLSGVIFKECKLLGINFTECADFLFSVRFENCVLDYSVFMGKKMPKTQFLNTSLKNVEFSQADLSGAKFDNTDLSGAVFQSTRLKEANFVTAINYLIDPELNTISKARFSLYGLPGLLTKYGIKIE